MEVAVELHDTLEAKPGTSVSRCSILERVDVVFDCLDWDAVGGGTFSQQFGIVNTLGT